MLELCEVKNSKKMWKHLVKVMSIVATEAEAEVDIEGEGEAIITGVGTTEAAIEDGAEALPTLLRPLNISMLIPIRTRGSTALRNGCKQYPLRQMEKQTKGS